MSDTSLFQLDSETAVLSLILKNPSLVYSTNNLRYFMFSSSPNQALFLEFEENLENNLAPDPHLIVESLGAKGELDKIGGKKYIEILMSKDFSESSFPKFVDLVMSSYKARTYMSILSGANNKEKILSSNIDDAIYGTRRALDALVESGSNLHTIHIGDITKAVFEEIVSRTTTKGVRGTTWGVKDIDKITGGKCGGDVWVIGGRPGSGKSALVCNSIYQDALNGIPSLLIAREMRSTQLLERLVCIDTGISNSSIRLGVLDQAQIELMRESFAKIKKLPIYLDTNFGACEPFYIESILNKFHNKYGVEVAYVDYIQLFSERDENQTQEIGKLSRLFKMISNQLDICTVVCSQLNRNVEARDDKRPMLSDLKQSGALEEDADYVVGLYRDEYYNKDTKFKNLMEFMIMKNRNGPTGTVTLGFEGITGRIGEAR